MKPDIRIHGVATDDETRAVLLAVQVLLADAASLTAADWDRSARYRAPNSWTARRGAPLSRPDAFA